MNVKVLLNYVTYTPLSDKIYSTARFLQHPPLNNTYMYV